MAASKHPTAVSGAPETRGAPTLIRPTTASPSGNKKQSDPILRPGHPDPNRTPRRNPTSEHGHRGPAGFPNKTTTLAPRCSRPRLRASLSTRKKSQRSGRQTIHRPPYTTSVPTVFSGRRPSEPIVSGLANGGKPGVQAGKANSTTT